MATTTRPSTPAGEDYLELVRLFPPRMIRDDEELDRAIAVVDDLLDRLELSSEQREYLAVLGLLIEDYERTHVELPDVTGVDLLRHLIEENELTQSDLAPLFGGNRSIVSEVLHGKRKLALSHIQRLAEYFGLPADLFIDRRDT
ncbi:MAG TPA: helix-turn-helix domain-containing protein [Nitrolancea sp.]|jgi:HTH-type transcriptional regulator/antitoxin HigA|nr:helix-turn-helix domain-containing protein [Nitrolancea sp.]